MFPDRVSFRSPRSGPAPLVLVATAKIGHYSFTKGKNSCGIQKNLDGRGLTAAGLFGGLKNGLQEQLGEKVKVNLAMRYGSRDIKSQLDLMRGEAVEELVILPLYPQYSVTTTESVFDAVTVALSQLDWSPELHKVEQYFDRPGWVHSVASSVRNFRMQHGKAEKLLFSMHGIPKRLVDAGDPYEQQCQQSVTAVAEVLKMQEESVLTYQSRVGREPWLEPYTDEVIKELAESGVKHIQVISPGFSVDCLETLEEIAIRYRKLFIAAGGEKFEYIPALNDSDAHISLLASVVDQQLT